MPADQAVWMPAHTKLADIGVAVLGDGSTLTALDRESKALVDLHAKAAADQVRVPKAIRIKLDEYHGMTKEAARWIGEVTYTTNHRTEPPYRDSVASRYLAGLARIGRDKTKGPKMRPPIEPRPVSLGGHALSPTGLADDRKTNGHMRCSLCRATSAKPSFCTTRCKGSAACRQVGQSGQRHGRQRRRGRGWPHPHD